LKNPFVGIKPLEWIYFISDINWMSCNIRLTPYDVYISFYGPHESPWKVPEYSFGRISLNLP
jgi:hypothetical protein